jgi:peptide deformylase
MAILEIKKYPDPILRKKAEEVKEITEEIKKIAQDMIETKRSSQGIGLAAPQVGILKRIIVLRTENHPQVLVNPEILEKSKEKEIMEEGCLSFPGLYLKIKRAKRVKVEALDEKGEKIKIQAEGLPARIFQHEIDHLDGILFIDRLSFWQKLKIKNQLKKLTEVRPL